uniref:Clr5 domain-containing protein n=1 Tax=Bionectria ochroleuca TaxID=29856 RepID=A0A8H7NCW7_BIOOC
MPPSFRKIRREVWERHKRTILDLWLNEKLPLKGSSENGRNLMQVMQDEHDFHATLWGAAKNLRRRDWEIILPLYDELERQGHAPRVRVGEHIFTDSKVKRARREYLKAGLVTNGDDSEQAPSPNPIQARLWHIEVRQDDGHYSEYSNTCLASNSLGSKDSSNVAQRDMQNDLPVTSGQCLHIEAPSPFGILSMGNTTEIEPLDSYLRLNSTDDPSHRNPDQLISSVLESYTVPNTLDIDFDGYALSSAWDNEIGNPISYIPFSISPPRISLNNQIEFILRNNLASVQSPRRDGLRYPSLTMVIERLISLPVANICGQDLAASSTQASYEISLREFSGRILYSIANNFAGLEGVDFATIFSLLGLVPGMESYFLEWLRSDNPMVSKPLAKNLFRAAIEAGNEQMMDIVLRTTSGRINKIDVDETILSHGASYSPIALASSRAHPGIVKSLLLHGAKARIPERAPNEVNFYGCPLEAILETLASEPDPAPEKQAIQIFESIAMHRPPDALELFVLILYGMQKTSLFNMRTKKPRSISRETGSKLLQTLFQTIPKEHYPELLNRNTDGKPRKFAKAIQPLLYKIIKEVENGIATNIAQSLLAAYDDIQFSLSSAGDYSEGLKEALILAILRNNTELTEYFLSLINPDDRHLTAAVHVGSLALIDSILDHGVSAHGRLLCSKHLCYAPVDSYWWVNGEAGMEALDRKCSVGREKGRLCEPTTPLAEGIRLQNTELIHRLENRGALVALLSEKGQLHLEAVARASSEVGNFSYLKQLLNSNLHFTPIILLKPIRNAIESRHFEAAWDLITLYLKAGSTIKIVYSGEVDYHMQQILFAIVRNHGGLEFLEQVAEYMDCFRHVKGYYGIRLLEEAVEIDDRVLHAAVTKRDVELVRLLLEWGASPPDLQDAVEIGDEAIVRLFLRHGAEPANEEAFSGAVMSSNKSLLPILISAFSSRYPNGRKCFGTLALIFSIHARDITILCLLLQAKLDVDSPHYIHLDGLTVLIKTIQMLEENDTVLVSMIRRILEAGADPETTNRVPEGTYVSALLQAIISNSMPMVELLLGKGADINRPAKRGLKRTPLQQACEQGGFQMIKYLLDRGADIHAPPAVNGGATAHNLQLSRAM